MNDDFGDYKGNNMSNGPTDSIRPHVLPLVVIGFIVSMLGLSCLLIRALIYHSIIFVLAAMVFGLSSILISLTPLRVLLNKASRADPALIPAREFLVVKGLIALTIIIGCVVLILGARMLLPAIIRFLEA